MNKMNKLFKGAVWKAFNKNPTVNDLFVLLFAARYMNNVGWREVEDVIEEVLGERPDSHECKKMIKKMIRELE